ncbi:MAG TPA: DUF2283 domain-containing protein [Bacteroidota bacterium]|jgi:uncharacterized protein YuzE|nr:DUF2283 domain-containing protein [Bacteroidota bacterium]
MKFNYYPETDSLYIDLSEKTSVESKEVANGVVIDFDDKGAIVGIDIDRASKIVDLRRLESASLPIKSLAIAS